MAKKDAQKDASRDGKRKGDAKKQVFGKADLEHFRKLLLTRRRRILGTVQGMEEEALKASDQDFSVDHMADHGSDNFEQDFTLALVESERRELFEIDRALLRIEHGTYGICEGTGDPIPRPRLEAIPWARYSVDYQRRLEAGEVEEEEELVGAPGEEEEDDEEEGRRRDEDDEEETDEAE
ncbi:MAG TPA: TraR/DksA family transcriptional regulator [Planctomycetota bacterium]|nr:TraR/DksA family transcriptional regulator [Planctomycetota bacterium]